MKFSFVQLSTFAKDWSRHGLTDDDLRDLELQLMIAPFGGAVIPGTHGLRKKRFAPPSWRTGKSGATRVCYAVFTERALIFLIVIFAKNEQANLNRADRNSVADYLKRMAVILKGKHQEERGKR